MHDHLSNTSTPASWGEAFAALPTIDPPDRWPDVAMHSGRGGRSTIGWLALAATLVVAVALPWKLQHETTPRASSSVSPASHEDLESLYAQSAQLEALLAYARDDRMSSGPAAMVSTQLDQRVASIDAALAQPHLTTAQQHGLWRQRVDALRTLASFESNRRLLSAQGEHYDGALVRID